jgi:hypothetical protein
MGKSRKNPGIKQLDLNHHYYKQLDLNHHYYICIQLDYNKNNISYKTIVNTIVVA